jgi:hypothetical protein
MVSASASPGSLLLPALAAVLALGLSGCVDAAPAPTPTGTAPVTLPTESASPTTPAEEPPGPLDITCGDLVDPDAVYAFDPNFALVGTFDAEAGSAAAYAVENGGVLCRWVRESGGMTIDLAAARLSDAELTALKDEAFGSSEMVPTYGDEAYFDSSTGTATVFQGSYWLVVTSPAFAEPGEPTGIIDSALAALAALPS